MVFRILRLSLQKIKLSYKLMEILELKKIILSKLKDYLRDTEAIGIFGSLARGEFTERSDIDVFVVLKSDEGEASKIWWHRISDALSEFGKDVTVLVYTIAGLKNISNWHVLRLASEGVIIYDKNGEVKNSL
jgi:predicted nucleotidyltransferase